jgi:membrane-bound lytic murein transglycosylase A
MKLQLILLGLFFLFTACSVQKTPVHLEELKMKNTMLYKSDFSQLPGFEDEDFDAVLNNFIYNCKATKARAIYQDLCFEAKEVDDAKAFIRNNFTPYRITNETKENRGLLTAYYEAKINASYTKSERYKYPVYATPNDLVVVELSAIYPELQHYRLRGRLVGNKLVPYFTREQSSAKELDAKVLCYCDSEIDKFFLEVQGSGIAKMDDNTTIYIGYANQNGHKYRAVGRYLIKIGALKREDVSLQSIRKWLKENPSRVSEVLNYNDSLVFFEKRSQRATGALGLELRAYRSIAVDKKYIPLGNMIYLHAQLNEGGKSLSSIVFAQDTGGAIKGSVRADLFVGSTTEAMEFAGKLKAPLSLWILLPNKSIKGKNE